MILSSSSDHIRIDGHADSDFVGDMDDIKSTLDTCLKQLVEQYHENV